MRQSPACPRCRSWHTEWDPDSGVSKCYECGYGETNTNVERKGEGWDDGLLNKLIKQ
jgi:hypothetical protein